MTATLSTIKEPGSLIDLLDDLVSGTPDVTGAIVASVDGLPVEHVLAGDADPAGVAAMAATAAGLAQRIAGDLELGDFAETVVRGARGYLVVHRAGTAVLAVIAAEGANLGRIHLQARRTASALAAQDPQ